ncbi:hypothetical protein PybrP1_009315 [[Pythium] brassicae (nom. inval.)]|nr:hypothetical protein PybrP1_009315 [[Pythium] brassicae (nom. inval.)]
MADEPHAIVFFDVNKTVIMHDPVQGKGLEHILNDLLTERAFGSVEQDADGESHWRWNGASALQTTGAAGGGAEEYPMSTDSTVAKQNKKQRKAMRQDFTSPGRPGEGLAAEHRALLDVLRLPMSPATASLTAEELAAAREAAGLADSPYFFMLPAFFVFVQFMHARGAGFNIVFRTYGDDLARIAQEFNCFCEGRHPYFPSQWRLDGSDGGVDRRIHLAAGRTAGPDRGLRFGTFFRSDAVTALVMGTFAQPRGGDSAEGLAFYEQLASASPEAPLEVHTGLPAIHHVLTHAWRAQQATLAIRDFYPFWFRNCEAARAGKLLTLDPGERAQLHALFFDDNILPHDAHIVDARDVRDGSPLDFRSATQGVHLLAVEPLDVIRNDRFFIDQFLASSARWGEDAVASRGLAESR